MKVRRNHQIKNLFLLSSLKMNLIMYEIARATKLASRSLKVHLKLQT